MTEAELSIIGTGNIGRAIAVGMAEAGRFRPDQMILTRRRTQLLAPLRPRPQQEVQRSPSCVLLGTRREWTKRAHGVVATRL